MTVMDILSDAIRGRQSCRLFDQRRLVPHDVLLRMLTAASLAPSGKNTQPWRFRIEEEPSRIAGVAALLPANPWLARTKQLLFIYLDTSAVYNLPKAYMAIGACIENLLLEAVCNGAAACWVGECMEQADNIQRLLGTDPSYTLMAAVAVGYPLHKLIPAGRKPLSELLLEG